jgi:hypothetical protein
MDRVTRTRRRWFARLCVATMLCVPAAARAQGFAGVLTFHNDNARTGQNLAETVLTPVNVNSSAFGKLLGCKVDGFVYAQPLYVPGVRIRGKRARNVVYLATEHDSVYAFDADSKRSCRPLWKHSFLSLRARITTVPSSLLHTVDLVPEVGITGTPVIDPSSGTLYVIAKTLERGVVMQHLHALDIRTGKEKFGGPVAIDSSIEVPGSGDGSAGGHVPFNATTQNQRSGLLLLGGVVYAAWAAHNDMGPYHGWVIGFDAHTLQVVRVFNTTPNGGLGGIWMSADGISSDAGGDLYMLTGNGTFDADLGGVDYGDSFLRLGPGAGTALDVVDYFTPWNQQDLSTNDLDLGSGGPLLIDAGGAHPHEIVSGGKDGTLYVIDRDSMGGFNTSSMSDPQIVQELVHQFGRIYCAPSYFNGAIYVSSGRVTSGGPPGAGALEAFTVNSDGTLSGTPSSAAAVAPFAFPAPTVSISANGATGGIVWALRNESYGDPHGHATLYAFDAGNLANELYDSDQAGTRDQCGAAVKFTVPTVANGRVYVGGQRAYTVYGPLP